MTKNFELSTRTPKFLFVRLFWIARVSAWWLWESNQRHVLRQLQVLFCPRERPVWTIHDLRIFGANWCKKGQNSLFSIYTWCSSNRSVESECGNWTRDTSVNSTLAVRLNHYNKATVHNATKLRFMYSDTPDPLWYFKFFIKFLAQGVIENRHAPRR